MRAIGSLRIGVVSRASWGSWISGAPVGHVVLHRRSTKDGRMFIGIVGLTHAETLLQNRAVSQFSASRPIAAERQCERCSAADAPSGPSLPTGVVRTTSVFGCALSLG
jgi:Hox protein A13 N terminal